MIHKISEKTTEFIIKNQLATVCFVDENHKPYCINCFYVFDYESECLIMKSSNGTRHQIMTKESNDVSGTILPKVIEIMKHKGIQFAGKIASEIEIEKYQLKSKYFKKNPMSIAILGYIWAIRLEYIKHTDNALGFGKKIIWSK